MEIANLMILFVHTVDQGNFSAAARSLGHSPSAVSRQIRRLEDRLGVRLLNRSTRSITLTDEGRAFYERCAPIAMEIAQAEEMVTSMGEEVQGMLRVTATVAFTKAHLLPLFPEFLRRHPKLNLILELTDRPVDLVEKGVDVAIRFTEQITDLSVVARKLVNNKRVVCAAPAYLVGEDIRAGRLIRLLPKYTHEKADLLAVYPDRRNLSPKVRAFIDFLTERFGPVPPWEQMSEPWKQLSEA